MNKQSLLINPEIHMVNKNYNETYSWPQEHKILVENKEKSGIYENMDGEKSSECISTY